MFEVDHFVSGRTPAVSEVVIIIFTIFLSLYPS